MKHNAITLGCIVIMLASLHIKSSHNARLEGAAIGFYAASMRCMATLDVVYTQGYKQALQDSITH